jgi:hypothetical protein
MPASTFGAPSHRHFKYNWISAGHADDGPVMSTMLSRKRANVMDATRFLNEDEEVKAKQQLEAIRLGKNTDNGNVHEQRKSAFEMEIEEREKRHAAGLGYGNKHPSHFIYQFQACRTKNEVKAAMLAQEAKECEEMVRRERQMEVIRTKELEEACKNGEVDASTSMRTIPKEFPNSHSFIPAGLGYGKNHRYHNAYKFALQEE